MPVHHNLAARVPDIPRWVETRDLLLSGEGEVFGLQEAPELALAVRDPDTGSVFVYGAPGLEAIRAAVQADTSEVIAAPEHAAWVAQALPGWRSTRAILHMLQRPELLPAIPPGAAGFLDPATLDQLDLPEGLLDELRCAPEIAATFVDGRPVSFCYACGVTEALWDISIDTLDAYRRRGYAALCVTFLIRHMADQGKQPVWGAAEDNPASWRLAQKLGFVPVDELMLFERPAPQPSPGAARHPLPLVQGEGLTSTTETSPPPAKKGEGDGR